MACTATVTKESRKEIIKNLEMCGCESVSISPDRPNIYYAVKKRTEIETDFADLVASLRKNLNKTSRVIVYCRSLNTCSDLYAHFLYELGTASYYPPNALQVSDNRLFGMFHACTPDYNKSVIMKSFSHSDGVVRVLFATVAFGMGVDIRDVNLIIHYGAPRSIEDYFQESGRGGRDGAAAKSIIYWKPSDCPQIHKATASPHRKELAEVRNYVQNTKQCRRKTLLNYFDPDDTKPVCVDSDACCDVCANDGGDDDEKYEDHEEEEEDEEEIDEEKRDCY